MSIKLHNSLTHKKEEFKPIDANNVRIYVCGPTVYDRPHIGNGRAVVVYDVLYRLLKSSYSKVTYVRNITDVDDKINAAAKVNGEKISELTKRVTGWFHEDMAQLGNLVPDIEPRATQEIPAIIALIEKIITNGHAYVAQNHVLFDVSSVGNIGDYYYGKLSGKKLEDLIAGVRIKVADYKRNPSDFVLWKPANEGDDESSIFDSPWGKGRPGWHIECSAMSVKYLGENFDIHGGGADLKFPHHENEIAQSCCANKSSSFANYWIHNGFLTVNGDKMSKSLGNFTTVNDLLEQGVKGETIRYALLSTKYNEPLDWNEKRISDAKKNLDTLYRALEIAQNNESEQINENITKRSQLAYEQFVKALKDDLNTPEAFSHLYIMAKGLRSVNADAKLIDQFKNACQLIGILQNPAQEWFGVSEGDAQIEALIEQRNIAKQNKNWAQADEIRDQLTDMKIILEDSAAGTKWRRK